MKMQIIVLLGLTVYAAILPSYSAATVDYPLEIVQGPTTQIVSAEQGRGTFFCRVKGKNTEWYINGQVSTTGRNEKLMDRGVEFRKSPRVNGTLNATISFPATTEFNSTQLRCTALNDSTILDSEEVVMTIAGPPLAPHPRVNVVNATELKVSWDQPFTWDRFQILDYTVTVYNSSEAVGSPLQAYTVTEPSKIMRIESERTNCSLLTFSVSARNDIGTSTNGIISGGFPVVPRNLQSAPEVTVRFTSDGTPEVKIAFQPPEVCNFQNAFYQVKVYSAIYGLVHEGKSQLIDNSASVVEAEITSQLASNADYTAVISYRTQFTSISANTSFSTAFDPTPPGTIDENKTENTISPTGKKQTSAVEDPGNDSLRDNLAAIISSAILGFVIIATITLIVIIAVVYVLRKRVNQRSEDRGKQDTMVDNPLYEGPIYESMPENNKRKLLLPKSKVNVQESLYLDSPAQSLPRDPVPAYDSLGLVVRANSTAEDKQYNRLAKGACVGNGLESSLDCSKCPPEVYQNTMLDPPVEDAYTIMSPAVPTANGGITCHTNYQATSNGDSVSGRYVMNATTSCPSSPQRQQQITLV